jgi:hypothetical protein
LGQSHKNPAASLLIRRNKRFISLIRLFFQRPFQTSDFGMGGDREAIPFTLFPQFPQGML